MADSKNAVWPNVKFGDVVRKVNKKVDPETSGLKRYIAGEHMDTDNLRISRWGTIGDGYLGPAFTSQFLPGQVLYGSRRTYLRKVAVPDFEGICANTTFVLEPSSPELIAEFLPHVMSTESFHAFSNAKSKGSVNPYINYSDLVDYEFALPPVEEQQRVSETLNSLDSTIDAWHEVRRSVSSARQSFCQEQFLLLAGLSDEIPLSLASTVIMGQSPPGSSYNCNGEGIPFLQGSGEFGEENPTPVQWTTQPKHVAEPGDILFSVRAPVGDINVAREQVAIGRGLAIIRPNRELSTEFISAALSFKLLEMKKDITGGVFDSITGTKLKQLLIPVPESQLQATFVAKFNLFNELSRESTIQIQSLRNLRRQILNSQLDEQNV